MYVLREREKVENQTVRERKRREEDHPLIYLFLFYFILVLCSSCFCYFCSFYFLFVIMVMAISIQLIDMLLDEECMIYQRSSTDMGKRGSHPLYTPHILCGIASHIFVWDGVFLFMTIGVVPAVGLFYSKPSV
jgi:hypothetical protein